MFQPLLDFESQKELLNYTFPFENELMWPYLRIELFHQLMVFEMQKHNIPFKPIHTRNKTWHKLPSYLWKSWRNRPQKQIQSQYDILIFSNDTFNQFNTTMGSYVNCLHDPFAHLFSEKTFLIESSTKKTYHTPRSFPKVAYEDGIKLEAFIKGWYSKNSGELLQKSIRFIQFLKSCFQDMVPNHFFQHALKKLISIGTQLPHYKQIYSKLIRRVQPKFIFINCACYWDKAFLIRWAHEWNIATIELQHGSIPPFHEAYHFSPEFAQNEKTHPYFPKYFMTWGKEWNKNLQFPTIPVVIGNPEFLQYLNLKPPAPQFDALIVSQNTLSTSFVQIAIDLAQQFPHGKFLFRPHPHEHFSKEQNRVLKHPQITIDRSSSIYSLIQKSKNVIGCYSTTLYEAAGFNKPIYVLDNLLSKIYLDTHLGKRFTSSKELILLLKDKTPHKTSAAEGYWASNWIENYREFIKTS